MTIIRFCCYKIPARLQPQNKRSRTTYPSDGVLPSLNKKTSTITYQRTVFDNVLTEGASSKDCEVPRRHRKRSRGKIRIRAWIQTVFKIQKRPRRDPHLRCVWNRRVLLVAERRCHLDLHTMRCAQRHHLGRIRFSFRLLRSSSQPHSAAIGTQTKAHDAAGKTACNR